MKRFFLCFMKNRKYILKRAETVSAGIFALWSAITLITATDAMLEGIKSVVLRIFVAVMIVFAIYFSIAIVIAVCIFCNRQVKLCKLHDRHYLYVEFGDLFSCVKKDERVNIAFAGNRCFDTIVDDDLIGKNRIHGIALERIFTSERTPDLVNCEIQNDLSKHSLCSHLIDKSEKRKGNLNRYDAGAVAEIDGLNEEKYFILGLTEFDSELHPHVSKKEYFVAMSSLIRFISERSQGYATYIPIIGAGVSGLGKPDELLDTMINMISFWKDELNCDIHIVVHDDDKNEIGLFRK